MLYEGCSCQFVASLDTGQRLPGLATYRIPGLDVDGARSRELTDEALTGCESGDDAAARDALEDVFCVPGDEVTVVDNILFAFGELQGAKKRSMSAHTWRRMVLRAKTGFGRSHLS